MEVSNICLIIGTQKGGTTSLFYYLSQHPQIAASKIKETNFFFRDSIWARGTDYYQGLWDWKPQKHRIALEASPNYTLSFSVVQNVIQRIKSLDARFKFIYILRNPLQKVESMREQGIYQGWYSKLLAKETPNSVPLEVIERVSYATIANRFAGAFSPENILLLKTEDLREKESAKLWMARICQFLEIDESFVFSLEKVHNAQNSYRQDTIWHALRESQYLNPVKNIFPDALKNNARNLLSKPMNQKKKSVPPLTTAQREFIMDALYDEMQQLEMNYQLNVSNWLKL